MRKMLERMALACVALMIALASPSSRADWPRFRGPNGSGIDPSANTPAKFDAKDFNWKVALPGFGHSSPVIVGKTIFVTCADQSTALRSLVCLDLDSGKILWQRDYPTKTFKQHGDNSYASGSPTADDQHVYFTFMTPDAYKVYCLDHAGKDVWTYEVGPWVSQHGAGCSPILVDDTLIVPNDQDGPTASLVALDKNTGSQRWQVARKPGKTAASTPCLFQPKGGATQIILTGASGLTSIDPKTGKVLWAIPDAMPFRSVGSPIATDSIVIGTCGEGGSSRTCVAVQPASEPNAEPKLLYKLPSGKEYPYVPSVVVKGDLLFTWSDIGTVTCSRVTTGEKVWQESVGQAYYSSPIMAGDKLYNITKKGVVICLAASDKFAELGRSDLDDKCHATPAIAGNRLIIRTATQLVSVGK